MRNPLSYNDTLSSLRDLQVAAVSVGFGLPRRFAPRNDEFRHSWSSPKRTEVVKPEDDRDFVTERL